MAKPPEWHYVINKAAFNFTRVPEKWYYTCMHNVYLGYMYCRYPSLLS